MKASTFADYRRRLRRVTQRISDHAAARMIGEAGDELTLSNLASIACWSPEHFARVWQDCTGEPPLASVRRSLLELSKAKLLEGEPVSSVAEHAGYSSGQAFAHAFHRQFGHSATCFIDTAKRKATPTKLRLVDVHDPIELHTARYSGSVIDSGEFSSECMAALHPILSRRAVGYFFMVDDLSKANITPNGRVEYTFGLSNRHSTHLNGRYDSTILKAGSYACFAGTVPGDAATIDDALREARLQRADGPIVERLFTDRALTPEPLREEYLWVPVAR